MTVPCAGKTAIFDDETPALVEQAKAICATCPVSEKCLALGLEEPWGVWGGLTTRERRALVKARAAESTPVKVF